MDSAVDVSVMVLIIIGYGTYDLHWLLGSCCTVKIDKPASVHLAGKDGKIGLDFFNVHHNSLFLIMPIIFSLIAGEGIAFIIGA